jgi:hypothetical protein
MKIRYTIHQITDKIFYLDFENRYDAGMFFLRYQEFYESSSPKFRNKSFSLTEYMDWYVKEGPRAQKEAYSFKYPEQWAGYNFPSNVIMKVWDKGIPDRNDYDIEMEKIHNKIYKQAGNFYLIGGCGFNIGIMAHEVAHGFFSTVPQYRKEMKLLVSQLPLRHKINMFRWLEEIGYTEQVFIDETQAYFSTGLNTLFMNKISDKIKKQFFDVYKEYVKDIDSLKNFTYPLSK